MQPETQTRITVDKKPFYAALLIILVFGGVLAFLYLDYVELKSKYKHLLGSYETLSSKIDSLQSTLENLYYEQIVSNLTAVKIYEQAKYSVVQITCTTSSGQVLGSGFVYRSDGYVITNNHVVENASSITVTFLDGTVLEAECVASDFYSDLAVIKVDGDKMPEEARPLILGNSSLLRVGEPVYAIGNPFGLTGSMTAGIVSQIERVLFWRDFGVPPPRGNYPVADVIQFDAAVNPGNSGGPLLNSLGEVVGVTFAIETGEEVKAFVGIGYAISSHIVRRVVPALIENKSYPHPWIGIGFDPDYVGGCLITHVDPEGPAQSKLEVNDIIIKVDNYPVKSANDLITYIEKYKSPNDTITLTVLRGNATLEIELTLGVRP